MKVKLESKLEVSCLFNLQINDLNALKIKSSLNTIEVIHSSILPPVNIDKINNVSIIDICFDVEIVCIDKEDLIRHLDLGLYPVSKDERIKINKSENNVTELSVNNKPFTLDPNIKDKLVSVVEKNETDKQLAPKLSSWVKRLNTMDNLNTGMEDQIPENKEVDIDEFMKKTKHWKK